MCQSVGLTSETPFLAWSRSYDVSDLYQQVYVCVILYVHSKQHHCSKLEIVRRVMCEMKISSKIQQTEKRWSYYYYYYY